MIWIIGDIHSAYNSFKQLVNRIESIDPNFFLYLLGDIFDRSYEEAQPLELYFSVLDLIEKEKCVALKGNHEQLLFKYIRNFFTTPEKKRSKLEKYQYNTFDLLMERLTEVDMLELADTISKWSIQEEVCINGINYLLAHARTSNPEIQEQEEYYLTGGDDFEVFVSDGVENYVSIVGHTSVDKVWVNEKKNVIMLDTGCGYKSGTLSCICLDTNEILNV